MLNSVFSTGHMREMSKSSHWPSPSQNAYSSFHSANILWSHRKGKTNLRLLVHRLQHAWKSWHHTLASEGPHQPTQGWAEGNRYTPLDDPNHSGVDWSKWYGILVRFFEGRCRKCGLASIQPVCETIWVHCLPCLSRTTQDWTSFRGLLSGSGTFVVTSYILPFAAKLNYPRLKRWIVENIPSKWVHDLKEIVDTIQETAVDIYWSKQKAMIKGDDGKKDIISVLGMILTMLHLHYWD